jgi:hypothetical protein
MTYDARPVTDPLGHDIFLVNDFQQGYTGTRTEHTTDDVLNVVRKPAILVSLHNGAEKLFYFRSIDWHNTLLLEVAFHHNRWEAIKAIWNPASEVLANLLKKGKKLI